MSMKRPLLASAAVYLVFTLAMASAVVPRLATRIVGDRGDPILNAGILAWNATHVPATRAWFDFPSFFPAANVTTFTEHLLGLSLVSTPLYWLTGDAVVTYNVTLLATYVFCGMAMFALVWRLTGSGLTAFVAGFAYAFAPYKMSQIAHLQSLAAFWAPLALLGLHGFLDSHGCEPRVRLRWLALFAGAWLMQGAANGYLLVFFTILVGLWVVWFVVAQGRWRDLAWIAAATAVAALPLAPVLLRYVEVHDLYAFTRSVEEIQRFSADISSVGCAPPGLALWGWLAAGACGGGERESFPGVAILLTPVIAAVLAVKSRSPRSRVNLAFSMLSALLAIAGMAMIASATSVALAGHWRWDLGPAAITSSSVSEPFSRGIVLLIAACASAPSVWMAVRHASVPGFYLLSALLMWALSWGPSPELFGRTALDPGPYAWLMLLPGVDGLRVPARFWMLTVLCLSVSVGWLLAAALRGRWRSLARVVAVVGVCGFALEGWARFPAEELLSRAPRADLIRGGVALTLPLGDRIERDVAAQFDAVVGGWRSVNGYSGYEPGHYQMLKDASGRADPVILQAFTARGELNVLVYEDATDLLDLVERYPGARLVGQARRLRQFTIPQQSSEAMRPAAAERVPIVSVAASCSPGAAPLVLDDDMATRWECGRQQPGQEITAVLGSPRSVGQVGLAFGIYPTDYPRDLVIETSVDGFAWSPARNGPVTRELFEAIAPAPDATTLMLPFPPREARYVRLRLMSEEPVIYWSVAGLEIWTGS